jgi:hypothetical protein
MRRFVSWRVFCKKLAVYAINDEGTLILTGHKFNNKPRRINVVRDFFSIKEAADVLGIYEVSAKELLDGTIDFEPDELFVLASSAGVSLTELLS